MDLSDTSFESLSDSDIEAPKEMQAAPEKTFDTSQGIMIGSKALQKPMKSNFGGGTKLAEAIREFWFLKTLL